MNTDRVHDRLLERLAAGALDEAESTALMSRLEAEPGGVERLEALLADNEDFLERYPPRVIVPQILERQALERQALARPAQARSSRPILAPLALAAALILIVGAWIYLRPAEPPSEVPSAIAVAPHAEEPSGHEGAPRLVLEAPLPELAGADELVLQTGESRSFGARHVERVVIEDADLLDVESSEDGRIMTFTGLGAGVTGVQIEVAGQGRPLMARIAEAVDPTVAQKIVRDEEEALRTCAATHGARGPMTVRATIDFFGRIQAASVDASSLSVSDKSDDEDAQSCVLEAVRGWRFPVIDGERKMSVVILEIELR
ncbi:MAG: hypothetical protein ACNA8W_11605 [Bradymonadaceae bacterium]